MATGKTYDPFAGYKLVSEMWEKQLNGLLYKLTDNKEFVQTANIGLDAYSRYLERLRKNQELIAAFMNIPTKKDVANVAKLSIQVEEKMDILEEQIWNLQDGLSSLNKGNLEMFQETVKIVKEMKTEFQKIAREVSETKKMKADLQELRQGLVDMKIIQVNLQELRKEIEGIKSIKADIKQLNDSKESNHIQTDIQELKLGVAEISNMKTDLAALKHLIEKDKQKQKKEPEKEQDKELVLTGVSKSN
ncbi:hypothetical protein [Neobacillus sp.]|uniref:hypothetical protein n=1 Tax=Neobacillus sp. TaxID=2675273 RepID=UPI00289F2DCD|nr:hypothetical protein [Neobacillus sp.]